MNLLISFEISFYVSVTLLISHTSHPCVFKSFQNYLMWGWYVSGMMGGKDFWDSCPFYPLDWRVWGTNWWEFPVQMCKSLWFYWGWWVRTPYFDHILTILWPFFDHFRGYFDHILTILWPYFDNFSLLLEGILTGSNDYLRQQSLLSDDVSDVNDELITLRLTRIRPHFDHSHHILITFLPHFHHIFFIITPYLHLSDVGLWMQWKAPSSSTSHPET